MNNKYITTTTISATVAAPATTSAVATTMINNRNYYSSSCTSSNINNEKTLDSVTNGSNYAMDSPLTPTRIMKKVSFSDDIITPMATSLSTPITTTTTTTATTTFTIIHPNSNNNNHNAIKPEDKEAEQDRGECDYECGVMSSPLEFMSNQTRQYLQQLHNNSIREEDEEEDEEEEGLGKGHRHMKQLADNVTHKEYNLKKDTFTTSLSINLSRQMDDKELAAVTTALPQSPAESSGPIQKLQLTHPRNIPNENSALRDDSSRENPSGNNLTYACTDSYNSNSSRSSSIIDDVTTASTLSEKLSNSNYSLSLITPLDQSRTNSITEDVSTFSTMSINSRKSITSTPSTPLSTSYVTITEEFDNCTNKDDEPFLYMERNKLRNNHVPCSSMELEAKRDKTRWLLISECSGLLGDGKHTREGFRKLFLDQEFQQKFFQLFDLENNGYLMQDLWIEHLKGRLTHEREMDYAEQLESVTYVICGENSKITFKNFSEIWHTRGIFNKLYRLIDKEDVNLISTSQIMEFISNLTNLRPRTGFDKRSLARLEQLFRDTVGNEKEIRREEFRKIVASKNPFFTERVFQIFDKDNSGSISLQEFIDSIHQFSGQSADDKIRFLFKVYDIDGDGLIQHKELHDVIRACMEENSMEFSEEQIEDLTIAMFEDADPHNRGEITYEALKNQLHKHGGLLENLSITIDRWLVPVGQTNEIKKKSEAKFWQRIPIPHQLTPAYMKNNHVFVTYLFVYIAINVCLFVSRAIQYRHSNIFVILARACGQCLNFNCAWILVLMLRHTLTYLRSRGLSTYLPVDNHIYLHKMAGFVVSLFSLIHTIMHLFNFSIIVVNDAVLNKANYTLAEWLLTSRPGLFGLVPGCANPTGLTLFIILLIMFICSQPFVRRKGSFEVFYWTHLLYIPFWVLCIFHGPNFWKWFLLPGTIYIVERIWRFVWMRGEHGKTYISSGLLLPSKVIHLVIKRPFNFNFRPGDYVFVNIPTIAKYEWHPFTISSAPEQEDYMWLHIRTVGEWTNRLYQYFEKEHQKLYNGTIITPHKQAIPTSSFLPSNENSTSSTLSPGRTPQMDFLVKNLNKLQQNGHKIDTRMQQKQTFTTSKLANQNINAGDVNVESNGTNDRIRSIKQTLQRTFSRKDSEPKDKDKNLVGHTNDAFVPDEHHHFQEREVNADKENTRKKLQRLLLNRPPLEKTVSLPDMVDKPKNKSYLRRLYGLGRSESERSFNQGCLRRHRLNSEGLAYLSPQNRSLAQSFRYMRNKPVIIPFKAPKHDDKSAETQSKMEATSKNQLNYMQNITEQKNTLPKLNLTEKMGQLNFNADITADYIMAKPLEDVKAESSKDGMRPSLRRRGTYATLSSLGTINGKIALDEGSTEIFIDGPYGAPSSHIFMAQHAVLIGTGIGVTPFASILQSIMHRYWKARHTCPQCNYEWSSEIPKSVMNLRKVDFFWINRDQRSFEWFVNLLSQLEIEQAELGGAMERFLDMHMYITSALQKTDMKAVCLQLALDLLHEKGKRDLITGLKTRTNAGRPNWDKVFKQLQAQKKGKVTIFYCGPPQLAKTLRYKCDEYGFTFRKECF